MSLRCIIGAKPPKTISGLQHQSLWDSFLKCWNSRLKVFLSPFVKKCSYKHPGSLQTTVNYAQPISKPLLHEKLLFDRCSDVQKWLFPPQSEASEKDIRILELNSLESSMVLLSLEMSLLIRVVVVVDTSKCAVVSWYKVYYNICILTELDYSGTRLKIPSHPNM